MGRLRRIPQDKRFMSVFNFQDYKRVRYTKKTPISYCDFKNQSLYTLGSSIVNVPLDLSTLSLPKGEGRPRYGSDETTGGNVNSRSITLTSVFTTHTVKVQVGVLGVTIEGTQEKGVEGQSTSVAPSKTLVNPIVTVIYSPPTQRFT